MLVAFLATRPHRAGLRIDDFHRRRETLAQRSLVNGDEIAVGAGQEKHAVDMVGAEIVQPLAGGRIVEPRDRRRVGGAPLEGRIEFRAARAEKLNSVLPT